MRDSAGQPVQNVQARLRLAGTDAIDDPTLDALVEALLLVAGGPVASSDLAAVAGVPLDRVGESLTRLGAQPDRGWVLVHHDGMVGLASSPRFAASVRQFLRLERESRLSGAALETLAVVAYRQPVSRAEIEAVRGVDCSGVLATLHARGLIEQVGRSPGLGSPILYGTTVGFLHHFALRSLDELPPLGVIDGEDGEALLDGAIAAASPENPAGPGSGDGLRRATAPSEVEPAAPDQDG